LRTRSGRCRIRTTRATALAVVATEIAWVATELATMVMVAWTAAAMTERMDAQVEQLAAGRVRGAVVAEREKSG